MKVFVRVVSACFLSVSIFPVHAQWIKTSGPDSVRALASGSVVVNGDVVVPAIAAVKKNGVHVSTNGGTNWSDDGNGLHSEMSAAVAPGQALYVGANGGGVYRGSGFSWGFLWVPANNGLTDISVRTLAFAGMNLYAGTDGGVFRSTNGGTDWAPVNVGLTNLAVKVLRASGSNVFAGTNSGMFVSTNSGGNWTQSSSGMTNTDIRAITISNSTVYAGTAGGGVFRTTDNGSTWTTASTGLTSMNIMALEAFGTNVFAGTDSGVFLSTNGAASWSTVNSGLPVMPIRALALYGVSATPSLIFTGGDSGTWRRPIPEMITSLARPSGKKLVRFHLATSGILSFTLPVPSRVTLEAFTPDGRRAAVLLSEDLPAGAHARRLNTTSLRSGLYFYRLRAGEMVETRKVMVSK